MKKEPVTIDRSALLQEALALMEERSIRHLPVVEGDQLVGFITQNDLRQFFFPSAIEDIRVHQAMVLNPLTVNVNASIEHAAKLIHDFKIGGLPVLDRKKLVGIITASDILYAFIEVMGLLKSSVRIDVIAAPDGDVEDLVRIVRQQGCEIISVATESHSSRKKVHYFRLASSCEIEPVVAALEKAGHKVVSVME